MDTERSKGFIYLIQADDKLKVGFTRNVPKRIKELQRWAGEIHLVKSIKGTIYLEKKFHKFLQSQGEYFGDEWYPDYRLEEIRTHMTVLNSGSFN